MLKKIGQDLYQRIFVAKKTTLVALVVVPAADVIVQNLLASQNQVVHAIAGVLALLLVAYKGKATAPATP